jgi:hypothetical protein
MNQLPIHTRYALQACVNVTAEVTGTPSTVQKAKIMYERKCQSMCIKPNYNFLTMMMTLKDQGFVTLGKSVNMSSSFKLTGDVRYTQFLLNSLVSLHSSVWHYTTLSIHLRRLNKWFLQGEETLEPLMAILSPPVSFLRKIVGYPPLAISVLTQMG